MEQGLNMTLDQRIGEDWQVVVEAIQDAVTHTLTKLGDGIFALDWANANLKLAERQLLQAA